MFGTSNNESALPEANGDRGFYLSGGDHIARHLSKREILIESLPLMSFSSDASPLRRSAYVFLRPQRTRRPDQREIFCLTSDDHPRRVRTTLRGFECNLTNFTRLAGVALGEMSSREVADLFKVVLTYQPSRNLVTYLLAAARS